MNAPDSPDVAGQTDQKAHRKAMFGWAVYDWANNGFGTLIQTFVFAAYFSGAVAADDATGTTQWGHMLSISWLIIALGGPVLGAIADQTGRRKPWIAFYTALCVVCTAALWFVQPDPSWTLYALIFAGLATIGSESAFIFYNAMLPTLVPRERMGRWSGWGWALGYAGGLVSLAAGLVLFINESALIDLPRDTMHHVRAVCLVSAAWYGLFALPLFFLTPDAPSTGVGLLEAARKGIGQLRQSFTNVRKYKHIVRFLIARMVYNDALTTTFAFGGIYAAGTFGMGPSEIMLFGIGLNVTAGLGALAFSWIDDYVGPRQTILVSLVALIACGTAILLVNDKTHFMLIGLGLGAFFGPVQASSRSWLARTAPPELSNQFFGLFALSGKLISFAGPFFVATLTDVFDSQRAGMSAVVIMFTVGALILLTVPRASGR